MRITITYPEIMKMEITSAIEIQNPKTITLKELQEKIYKNVWDIFKGHYSNSKISEHGEPDQVCLKDKDIEIDTDQKLRDHLYDSCYFQAVFKKVPDKTLS